MNHIAASIDRDAMEALRMKLHGDEELTTRERTQLSGLLAILDLQVELTRETPWSEALAWHAIRDSIARKFPRRPAPSSLVERNTTASPDSTPKG